MSRYDLAVGVEGQFEPGSRRRVLRNLAGITRVREMHQAEHDALLEAQEEFLKEVRDTTRFTAAMLYDMHRAWLGSLYSWAGSYRQVEMAKGGFRWPLAMRVAENMAAFEAGMLQGCTPCRPGALLMVAWKVAQVHAEFLLIHPFREGNGRMARWLADLMVAQAGLPTPDYGFEGRGSRHMRERYLKAVIAGYRQDYIALRDFFADAVERQGNRILTFGGSVVNSCGPRRL